MSYGSSPADIFPIGTHDKFKGITIIPNVKISQSPQFVKGKWVCGAVRAGCPWTIEEYYKTKTANDKAGGPRTSNKASGRNDAMQHMDYCPYLDPLPTSTISKDYDPVLHADMPKPNKLACQFDDCTFETWGRRPSVARNRIRTHEERSCTRNPLIHHCDNCDEDFGASQWVYHQQTCGQPAYCDVCFAKVGIGYLQAHKREVCRDHPLYLSRQVTCDTCGYVSPGPKAALKHWCGALDLRAGTREGSVDAALDDLGVTYDTQVRFVVPPHGDDDNLSNIRVDFELLSLRNIAKPQHVRIMIECDEYFHSTGERSRRTDDSSRGRRLYASSHFTDSTLIFVRFNPDPYSVDKRSVAGPTIAQRIEGIIKWLEDFLEDADDLEQDYYLAYFYYPVTFTNELVVRTKPTFDQASKTHVTHIYSPAKY